MFPKVYHVGFAGYDADEAPTVSVFPAVAVKSKKHHPYRYSKDGWFEDKQLAKQALRQALQKYIDHVSNNLLYAERALAGIDKQFEDL